MSVKIEVRLVIFAFVVFAVITAILAGAVWEIFDDPTSRTSQRILMYQTFLGSLIAVVAAAFTAGIIYISALMPLKAETSRNKLRQQEERKLAAAILIAEIVMVIDALNGMDAMLEHFKPNKGMKFEEIIIPKQLRKMEILQKLSSVDAYEITRFIGSVVLLNTRSSYTDLTDDKGRKEMFEHTGKALKIGNGLMDDFQERVVTDPIPSQ